MVTLKATVVTLKAAVVTLTATVPRTTNSGVLQSSQTRPEATLIIILLSSRGALHIETSFPCVKKQSKSINRLSSCGCGSKAARGSAEGSRVWAGAGMA